MAANAQTVAKIANIVNALTAMTVVKNTNFGRFAIDVSATTGANAANGAIFVVLTNILLKD